MIDTADGQTTRQQQRYLAQVAARLADLPAEEREELLDELRQHLRDVAEEGDGDLEVQLGPPDAFTAELRTSAGLEATPAPSAGRVLSAIRDADRVALERARARFAVVAGHPEVAEIVAGLRRSVTLWWALRGYLAVLAFDVFQGGQRQLWSFPFPAVAGSRVVGVLLAALAAAASVALGRAARGGAAARVASRALTIGVGFGLLVLVTTVSGAAWAGVHADDRYADEGYVEDGAVLDGQLTSSTGEAITNLYPYGPDGQPLDRILLYDQDGRAVDLVVEHLPDGRRVVTSYPLAEDGTPVTNAFPQHQVLRPDPYADPGVGGDEHGYDRSTEATDPTDRPTVGDVPVLDPGAADAAGRATGGGADGPADGEVEDGPDEPGQ